MLEFKVSEQSVRALTKNLEKLGGDIEKAMIKTLEEGQVMVANHAKLQHAFVGTGRGSGDKAKQYEYIASME